MAFGKKPKTPPVPLTLPELAARREKLAIDELNKSGKMGRIEMAVLHATRAQTWATLALVSHQQLANGALTGMAAASTVMSDDVEEPDEEAPA